MNFFKNLHPLLKTDKNTDGSSNAGYALLQAIGDSLTTAETLAIKSKVESYLLTADGDYLDEFGSWFGVFRKDGQSDDDYRQWIHEYVLLKRGTVNSMVHAIRVILDLPDANISIYEPYRNMFTLDKSFLDGPDHLEGDYYRYAIITVNIDQGPSQALYDVIQSFKPAGVLFYINSQIDGGNPNKDTFAVGTEVHHESRIWKLTGASFSSNAVFDTSYVYTSKETDGKIFQLDSSSLDGTDILGWDPDRDRVLYSSGIISKAKINSPSVSINSDELDKTANIVYSLTNKDLIAISQTSKDYITLEGDKGSAYLYTTIPFKALFYARYDSIIKNWLHYDTDTSITYDTFMDFIIKKLDLRFRFKATDNSIVSLYNFATKKYESYTSGQYLGNISDYLSTSGYCLIENDYSKIASERVDNIYLYLSGVWEPEVLNGTNLLKTPDFSKDWTLSEGATASNGTAHYYKFAINYFPNLIRNSISSSTDFPTINGTYETTGDYSRDNQATKIVQRLTYYDEMLQNTGTFKSPWMGLGDFSIDTTTTPNVFNYDVISLDYNPNIINNAVSTAVDAPSIDGKYVANGGSYGRNSDYVQMNVNTTEAANLVPALNDKQWSTTATIQNATDPEASYNHYAMPGNVNLIASNTGNPITVPISGTGIFANYTLVTPATGTGNTVTFALDLDLTAIKTSVHLQMWSTLDNGWLYGPEIKAGSKGRYEVTYTLRDKETISIVQGSYLVEQDATALNLIYSKAKVENFSAPESNTPITATPYVGDNILAHTADWDTSVWNIADGATLYDGITPRVLHYSGTAPSGSYTDIVVQHLADKVLSPDTDYTLSFYAKGSGNLSTYIYPNVGDGSNGTSSDNFLSTNLTSEWKRYTQKIHTVKTISGMKDVLFRNADTTGLDIDIMMVKLEAGPTVTSWLPKESEPLAEYNSPLALDEFMMAKKSTMASLDFKVSTEYTLQFTASGIGNMLIGLGSYLNINDKDTLNYYDSIELTSTPKVYKYTFKRTDTTSDSSLISFASLGSAPDITDTPWDRNSMDYYGLSLTLKDVSIKESTNGKVVATTEGHAQYNFNDAGITNKTNLNNTTYTLSGQAVSLSGGLKVRYATYSATTATWTIVDSPDLGVTNVNGSAFKNFSYTFNLPKADAYTIALTGNEMDPYSYYRFKDIKLELGNVVTPFVNPNLFTDTTDEYRSASVTGWGTSLFQYIPSDHKLTLDTGQTYTFNVKIKTGKYPAYAQICLRTSTDNSVKWYNGETIPANSEGYSTVTVTLADATQSVDQVVISYTSNTSDTSTLAYAEAKFEVGKAPTEWTVADSELTLRTLSIGASKDFLSQGLLNFKGNTKYDLTFQARGSGVLRSYIYDNVAPGIDTGGMNDTGKDWTLTDTWTTYSLPFTTIANVSGNKSMLFRKINSNNVLNKIGNNLHIQLKNVSIKESPTEQDRTFYRFNNHSTAPAAPSDLGMAVGEAYSLSGSVSSDIGQTFVGLGFYDGTDWDFVYSDAISTFAIDGKEFNRFEYTFTVPEKITQMYVGLELTGAVHGNYFKFKDVKLEKGSTVTPNTQSNILTGTKQLPTTVNSSNSWGQVFTQSVSGLTTMGKSYVFRAYLSPTKNDMQVLIRTHNNVYVPGNVITAGTSGYSTSIYTNKDGDYVEQVLTSYTAQSNNLPDLITYKEPKLEEGIVPTAWTVADSELGDTAKLSYVDDGSADIDFLLQDVTTLKPSTRYTFSFTGKGTGYVDTYVYPTVGNVVDDVDNHTGFWLTDTETTYRRTFTTRADVSGTKHVIFRQKNNPENRVGNTLDAYISNPRLEEGATSKLFRDTTIGINGASEESVVTAPTTTTTTTKAPAPTTTTTTTKAPVAPTTTTTTTKALPNVTFKIPVSLVVGSTVPLRYQEYSLDLVGIGTEPTGMFTGGNMRTLEAKVVSSTDNVSSVQLTTNEQDFPDGTALTLQSTGVYAAFNNYKGIYYG